VTAACGSQRSEAGPPRSPVEHVDRCAAPPHTLPRPARGVPPPAAAGCRRSTRATGRASRLRAQPHLKAGRRRGGRPTAGSSSCWRRCLRAQKRPRRPRRSPGTCPTWRLGWRSRVWRGEQDRGGAPRWWCGARGRGGSSRWPLWRRRALSSPSPRLWNAGAWLPGSAMQCEAPRGRHPAPLSGARAPLGQGGPCLPPWPIPALTPPSPWCAG
jgi:hypothetical protein